MSFLPKGYSAPKAESNYLKPTDGQIKFRVISQAIVGVEYWKEEDNKKIPVRLREMPQNIPNDIQDNGEIKHFIAFTVIDRWNEKIKIFESTQVSVIKAIESIVTDVDWGEPTGYDISVTGTGQGKERRYSTVPCPPKELTKEEKELVKKTPIELEALFHGEDPFKWVKPVEVEEEVKISDVPFK